MSLRTARRCSLAAGPASGRAAHFLKTSAPRRGCPPARSRDRARKRHETATPLRQGKPECCAGYGCSRSLKISKVMLAKPSRLFCVPTRTSQQSQSQFMARPMAAQANASKTHGRTCAGRTAGSRGPRAEAARRNVGTHWDWWRLPETGITRSCRAASDRGDHAAGAGGARACRSPTRDGRRAYETS